MRKSISSNELDVLQQLSTKNGKVDYDKFAKMIEYSLLDKEEYKQKSKEIENFLKFA